MWLTSSTLLIVNGLSFTRFLIIGWLTARNNNNNNYFIIMVHGVLYYVPGSPLSPSLPSGDLRPDVMSGSSEVNCSTTTLWIGNAQVQFYCLWICYHKSLTYRVIKCFSRRIRSEYVNHQKTSTTTN